MSDFSQYYGTNRDASGHYQPSVPSSLIPTLTHLQSNVYGHYSHANGLISFDDVKGLPLTYFHSYPLKRYHQLEHSNKIILPSTVLAQLSQYDNLVYPLIFQVDGAFDLLGVAEFDDDIDVVYLPHRIFEKILQSHGLDSVNHPISIGLKLHNQELARGTNATLRAHDAKFIEIEDHQTYLQLQLEQFYSILQEGEVLDLPPPDSLNYPKGNFLKVDVVKTAPEKSIIITDTNLSIDFEEPLNYQDYLKKKKEEKEAQQKQITDQLLEKNYQRVRQWIPEYGPNFWDDREKKVLEETGMMPLPYITLPDGQHLCRLKFQRKDKESNLDVLNGEKPKLDLKSFTFKSFDGVGHTFK